MSPKYFKNYYQLDKDANGILQEIANNSDQKKQTTLPIRPVHAWLLIFKCFFLLENVLLSLLVDCNDCTVFCFESKSLL